MRGALRYFTWKNPLKFAVNPYGRLRDDIKEAIAASGFKYIPDPLAGNAWYLDEMVVNGDVKYLEKLGLILNEIHVK